MPSYRVTITIGALRPGVLPQSLLPEAARAVAEVTNVEATDIAIVSGMPRITVRFTGDDAVFARNVGAQALHLVSTLAETLACTLTERVKGRWLVVKSQGSSSAS